MSRHIQTADPESRKLNNQTEKGKLILTEMDGRSMSFLLRNDILISAQVIPLTDPDKTGEIYIGKIKNVLPNISAYFVEIGNGQTCYLSFKDAKAAYVLNRSVSGSEASRRSFTTESQSLQISPQPRLVQGDELPVQIIRNALKTKPAAVSTELELQSEYFVIKAGASGLGVSNKISKNRTREIRKLLEDAGAVDSSVDDSPVDDSPVDDSSIDFTVIARTSCENLENTQLVEEYHKQRCAFLDIYHKAKYRTCYSCLLGNESPILTAVKRIPAYEYDEIITDIPEFFEILNGTAPNTFKANESGNIDSGSKIFTANNSIRLYSDATFPLAKLYGLQTKLENAASRKVWLKSGANLIIEQTECLTTIDVNTGKNIKGKVSEETIFQVNKEAAKEAAVQLRLRNLSGIIIIDFINMKEKKQEEELLAYLRDLVSKDPVTTVVVDMTPLGLVEITRKKINMSLQEQLQL